MTAPSASRLATHSSAKRAFHRRGIAELRANFQPVPQSLYGIGEGCIERVAR
jgi:hypothetical protein